MRNVLGNLYKLASWPPGADGLGRQGPGVAASWLPGAACGRVLAARGHVWPRLGRQGPRVHTRPRRGHTRPTRGQHAATRGHTRPRRGHTRSLAAVAAANPSRPPYFTDTLYHLSRAKTSGSVHQKAVFTAFLERDSR